MFTVTEPRFLCCSDFKQYYQLSQLIILNMMQAHTCIMFVSFCDRRPEKGKDCG